LDVIEHLPRPDGLRLLREMERVSRGLLLVFTPNGFLPQAGDSNPHQEHLSGWTAADLRREGFAVRGLRGIRRLRTSHNQLVLRPLPFGYAMSTLTSPIVWAHPSSAFQLLGVRHLAPDARPG
ncbi:MAG: SAM-dependent methyltransferase, partial [Thermoplasmata archaeon]|nr:SAM-dependent methyltransferase [Thermoplasmata archaeon]